MTPEFGAAGGDAPVLMRVDDRVGRITLNRPKALHALNVEMCRIMLDALLAWREDDRVRGGIIDHSGERGFCAGGDIRRLAEGGASAAAHAVDFFCTEYRMNSLLFSFGKPIAAVMDGIVMGGGVGISMPCRFRVATERTLFAMPETSIGLFPDVGGGWHLSRLPGETGTWIALTGARLKAADCLALGIATHFVESGRVEALKAWIVADLGGGDDAEALMCAAIEGCAGDPGPPSVTAHRAAIDRLFAFDTVEEIFAALEADGSEWARSQLELLRTKSPQALKISLRQLRTGRKLKSFDEDMAMEFRIASRAVLLHDFREGVRAVLVDKDNTPTWRPSSLEGVTPALLDSIFARLPADQEWTPLP
ncbi:MAG TPA: enoyl-CoA hydratase/isomerase family protein [Caulobacteraceae bacterium]